MPVNSPHPSSYRDPAGFIFQKDGVYYRQVNLPYRDHFHLLMDSGLYQQLTDDGLLIRHQTIEENLSGQAGHFITLKPEQIDFITYPYEWSFSMLKDAALLTLQIAQKALASGMILKDATPFNIQWHKGKMLFIDTLSFEKFEELPWIAYRQFCETFLGPLLLMHYQRKQLPELMKAWPEGVPLPIVSSWLPWKSRFSLYTYLHVHLHARLSGRQVTADSIPQPFSKKKLQNLLVSLESLIRRLRTPPSVSTWSAYYDEASLRNDYIEQKKKIIEEWINGLTIGTAADLGANTGEFSRLLASHNIRVVSTDFDPYCINDLYTSIISGRITNIQPLVMDLASPSPGIGVNNEERTAFIDRSGFDLLLALALIHHLAIGRNIPFARISEMFSRTGEKLIIEFVPKDDDKVREMLSRKKDIYDAYTADEFEISFSRHFNIIDKRQIPGSGRTLYLMERYPRQNVR